MFWCTLIYFNSFGGKQGVSPCSGQCVASGSSAQIRGVFVGVVKIFAVGFFSNFLFYYYSILRRFLLFPDLIWIVCAFMVLLRWCMCYFCRARCASVLLSFITYVIFVVVKFWMVGYLFVVVRNSLAQACLIKTKEMLHFAKWWDYRTDEWVDFSNCVMLIISVGRFCFPLFFYLAGAWR